jgi:hypothetical protein
MNLQRKIDIVICKALDTYTWPKDALKGAFSSRQDEPEMLGIWSSFTGGFSTDFCGEK